VLCFTVRDVKGLASRGLFIPGRRLFTIALMKSYLTQVYFGDKKEIF
jgi:hypothetical protein